MLTATSLPRSPAVSLRRNPAAPWRHLDVILLGATLAVAGLGVLMVFSATRRSLAESGSDPYIFLKRQTVFVVIGLLVLAATSLVDYRRLREVAPVGFVLVVLALAAVLSPLGTEVNGAQAWFQIGAFQVQPAEFAKLALIVVLAAYGAAHRGHLDGFRLITVLALAAVPMGLIFLQPDVGTMFVFVAVVLGVLLVAGAHPRHLVALALVGIIGVLGVLRMGFIEDYQRDRLTSFLDTEGDPQVSSYNQAQSVIAVGGGGLTGAGLFQGSQTNLSYVPEQQTDFIFTVVGEELGFLGASTLLLLFVIIAWRIWRAAQVAKDLYGTLICTGVLAMIGFQVFQNVGMTMGIMPVTGIPLPLVSYGGSSALTMFAAVGLVLNVHMRRFS